MNFLYKVISSKKASLITKYISIKETRKKFNELYLFQFSLYWNSKKFDFFPVIFSRVKLKYLYFLNLVVIGIKYYGLQIWLWIGCRGDTDRYFAFYILARNLKSSFQPNNALRKILLLFSRLI